MTHFYVSCGSPQVKENKPDLISTGSNRNVYVFVIYAALCFWYNIYIYE